MFIIFLEPYGIGNLEKYIALKILFLYLVIAIFTIFLSLIFSDLL